MRTAESVLLTCWPPAPGVVDFRRNRHTRKRGVSTGLRIEGRDPHQAVYTIFGLEMTERKIPLDGEGRTAKTGLFTRLLIDHFGLETAPLCPAQIHPHQHFRPVARVCTARTGVDRDDRVGGVVFAAEHLAKFCVHEILCGGLELLRSFCARLLIVGFTSQVEQHFGIFEVGFERIEEGDLALHDPFLPQDLFGGLPILPQIGPGRFGLERVEALAQCSNVKDASGAHRTGCAACAFDL